MLKIKARNNIFLFIAVIGLLIFLHFIKVLVPLENIIISAINPLASRIYSVSSDLRLTVNEQADKRDLLAAIENFREKVNQLTVKNAQLKTIEEENRKLRQHLKFLTQNEFNYVLANVISQGIFAGSAGEEQIIIDKGLRDGLSVNLGVVNSQGIIVGKIVEVRENISKACLSISRNCKLAAVIQGQESQPGGANKTSGVIEGDLGLTMKMNFIPQAEKIKAGDMVVTSGLEKNIPRGLVIGKIIQVASDSNEVWQKATVESLVNLDELTIVSVLLP